MALSILRNRVLASLRRCAVSLLAFCALYISTDAGSARQHIPRPGDAYATRFSGTTALQGPGGKSLKIININGVVGSLVGLSSPQLPRGQHLTNEPQSLQITAGQVGQVFGIAIDDAAPANIYLSATSAFGLHISPVKSGWMQGMWGNGGAGGIYRLSAQNGFQPELFAIIALNGRPNSGASLGNIAYDRWHRQLFVSDLETGMIHRLDAANGIDAGHYDHGVQGRQNFFDVQSATPQSLPPVAFDPGSAPRYTDCPGGGDYTKLPACWNVADFRRRVWGLGVHRDPASRKVRLYYAVWGSQSFGNPDWDGAGDNQRNSIWSVGLDPGGNFDTGDVRREFLIPGFFAALEDFQRAGGSQPVSDIAFSSTGDMLIAERGGLRNLGLDKEEAFASPHESRVLRYHRNASGAWVPDGRYDIGFYERKGHNKPYLRASGAGGVDFGFGYTRAGQIDLSRPNAFVWITGDDLCSPDGRCKDMTSNTLRDGSHVTGLQGGPASITAEIAPEIVFRTPYPAPGPATPATGPLSSYMIDLDQNVDETGVPIPEELARNDATHAGDVEIFRRSAGAPPAPPVHLPVGSRPGVIIPPPYDHFPPGSTHWPPGTQHWPPGSYHWPAGSGHWPVGSGHWPVGSGHWPPGSKHLGRPSIHWPPGSIIHRGKPSLHWPPGSKHKGKKSLHWPPGSKHKGKPSFHFPKGSKHKFKPSLHWPPGSVHLGSPSLHWPKGSKHFGIPSIHWPKGSKHKGKPSLHWPPGSKIIKPPHWPPGSKHKGKPSLHWPPGSKHKGKPSLHWPPGSK
ncbi:MAG: hypothetical protein IIB62_10650, partial [Proteobacteria bacterium]|nr:hypothetical protein [Pseudomonadota bacterium]